MPSYEQIKRYVGMTRPGLLLAGFIVYAMGAGIAHYLGATINWNIYWLGQAWLTLVQISKHLINEYFDGVGDSELTAGASSEAGQLQRLPELLLSAASLTVAASLTFALLQATHFNLVVSLIMVTGLVEAFLYATPPVRLSANGFGEMTTALVSSLLAAALSLVIQFGHLHRLVAMTAFPLTMLHIAMLLTPEFAQFARDIKIGKKRLLVLLGWERAASLHNLLILTAFGLLGVAMIFGLPFSIGGPAMLALPIAILELWLMNNLTNGARPNYNLMSLNAYALYFVSAYLLTFAFWTH